MTISRVGSNTSGSTNPTSGNWTLSGLSFAAGDIGLFWWFTNSNAKTITEPATVTQQIDTLSIGRGRLFVGYRVLEAGDTTFGWTSNSVVNSGTAWGVDVFRGIDFLFTNTSGADATSYTNDNTPQPPAVTPTYGNSLIYAVVSGNATGTISDPSGVYSRSSIQSVSGLVGCFVGTFYRVLDGGAGSPQQPDPLTATPGSTLDGLMWSSANGPAADLVFPSGTYNLSLSDVSFTQGRLITIAGSGGGYTDPRPTFYRQGQEETYRKILELERQGRLKDDELAVLLIGLLSYDDDVA